MGLCRIALKGGKPVVKRILCLLLLLLTAWSPAPTSQGGTVSGSLTLSLANTADGVSVSVIGGADDSAVSTLLTVSQDPAAVFASNAVKNAALKGVASLIKPDVFSNGVGLRQFVAEVTRVALEQPQFPVKDGKTIYGELFGTPRSQWCTEFVMYCLRQAEDALGTEFIGDVYCWRDSAWDTGIWFKRRGRYWDGDSGYIPTRGDLIIFDTQDLGYPNHTGMVIEVIRSRGGVTVKTIEGNIPEDEVKQIRSRTLAVDDPTILGYCSTTEVHEYTGSMTDYTY